MNTPDTYWDLFWGYSVIWGCIVFFVFWLLKEQRQLKNRLQSISERLERAQDEPAQSQQSEAAN